MRKISEVLRLKVQCHATNREIANACSIGVASVSILGALLASVYRGRFPIRDAKYEVP